MNESENKVLESRLIDVGELKPHPRNYRVHPDDQLAHVEESIRKNGFYKNIIAARDGTILAGHGAVAAAKKIGLKVVPVVFLDVGPEDPKALKVLIGNNEIQHLAEVDDRALSNLLKEMQASIEGIIGTGFDEQMLANLVFTTRPEHEILDKNFAAHWAGLPEYSHEAASHSFVVVSFASAEDREKFFNFVGQKAGDKVKSMWWPPRDKDDTNSVKFDASNA